MRQPVVNVPGTATRTGPKLVSPPRVPSSSKSSDETTGPVLSLPVLTPIPAAAEQPDDKRPLRARATAGFPQANPTPHRAPSRSVGSTKSLISIEQENGLSCRTRPVPAGRVPGPPAFASRPRLLPRPSPMRPSVLPPPRPRPIPVPGMLLFHRASRSIEIVPLASLTGKKVRRTASPSGSSASGPTASRACRFASGCAHDRADREGTPGTSTHEGTTVRPRS